MKKVLKLYQHIGRYVDSNEYLALDEDLQIDLDFTQPNNSKLIATLDNGSYTKKISVQNKSFVIFKDFIKVGVLKIKFEVMINGTIVQTFVCDDLIVKENNSKIELIPEIEILKEQINKEILTKEKLIKKIDKLTQLVSGLYKIKIKLIDKFGGEKND